MTWRTTAYGVAAAVVAALGLAASACGGDSEATAQVASIAGSTTEDDTVTTSTDEGSDDPQEILLDYTKCMREEGIDMPDPDFSNGPRGAFRVQLGQGVDPNDPEFQKAQETCGPILADLQQQFDPERQEEFQEAALEFARCMREHGVDIPDPDFSGGRPGGRGGTGGAFRLQLDPDDPKFQEAREACRDAFEGLGGGPGGGPRPGGEDDE